MKNTIGSILYYLRTEKGIKQEVLCRGLCTTSTMSRYENGDRIPDRLLLNAFIQRLGKSPDKFATIVSLGEYQYFMWRKRALESLKKGEFHKLQAIEREKDAADTSCNEILQKQFYYFLQGILSYEIKKEFTESIQLLTKSIKMTVPNFKGKLNVSDLVSSEEIHILLILAEKEMEIGDFKQGMELIESVIKYIDINYTDIQEKIKVYPRAVSIYSKFTNNHEERIVLCKKAYRLLIENKSFRNLLTLLKYEILDLKEMGKEIEALKLEQQRKALLKVYSEYKIDPNEKYETIDDSQQEIYLINEIIYTGRMKKAISQEEISEGICAVETYSRIETGKRNPSVKNYKAIIEKLNLNYGYYKSDIDTDNFTALETKWKLSNASLDNDLKTIQECLSRLKEDIDANVPENKQYIELVENCISYRLGRISEDELIKRDSLALSYTVSSISNHLSHDIFSRTEAILINHMAIAYKRKGNLEKAIQLWEDLLNKYIESKVSLSYHFPEIMPVICNLSNNLTSVNRHSEAIRLANIGIDIVLENKRGPLSGLLTIKAYALEQIGQNIDKCKELYKEAFYISDLLDYQGDHETIKRYYEVNFDNSMIWYSN